MQRRCDKRLFGGRHLPSCPSCRANQPVQTRSARRPESSGFIMHVMMGAALAPISPAGGLPLWGGGRPCRIESRSLCNGMAILGTVDLTFAARYRGLQLARCMALCSFILSTFVAGATNRQYIIKNRSGTVKSALVNYLPKSTPKRAANRDARPGCHALHHSRARNCIAPRGNKKGAKLPPVRSDDADVVVPLTTFLQQSCVCIGLQLNNRDLDE